MFCYYWGKEILFVVPRTLLYKRFVMLRFHCTVKQGQAYPPNLHSFLMNSLFES